MISPPLSNATAQHTELSGLSGEDPFHSREPPGGGDPALLTCSTLGMVFLLILQKLRSSLMLRMCPRAGSRDRLRGEWQQGWETGEPSPPLLAGIWGLWQGGASGMCGTQRWMS